MWIPITPAETQKDRHKRLLTGRIMKAQILNERTKRFIEDVNKSTIFNDSEKKQILSHLKINPS